jgi:lysozyme family protein
MSFLARLFERFRAPPSVTRVEGPLPMPVAAVGDKGDRFGACLPLILKHEGGYVDHPADPGGATNLGITHATLAAWRGKPVTKQDVRNLTVTEAAAIYRARYWDAVRGDELPAGVDLAVFDFAVNSGPGRAIRTLQGVLGVAQDGALGPVTMAALAKAPGKATVIVDLCDARMRFLRGLSTFATFGRGWTARVNAIEDAALKVAT